ncbi:Mce-associated membrane protein [Nocardia transvalensis]|uniref:Mce-associated membrane protein n=1 Tax=Nocardia transvalensis TaxID=37333 RepID=A0A7W9PKT3_9NOCA|nr:hypothetical protein [Nocardia transvalensis]MBB5917862.1 Mce-associated membrane protein [Nocardia transvalensis]
MLRITLRHFAITLPPAAVAVSALVVTPPAIAAPTDPAQLAACDFGRQFTTFDFNNYGDYDRRVLDRSTAPFHDQFQESGADRHAHVSASHTISEAKTVECSTESSDPEHAAIMVTVDQSTRSDGTLGLPQPIRSNMRVFLDNVDGRWLAARVDQVDQPR